VYGYETWPITLREEDACRLRMFVNRQLIKMFEHNKHKVTKDQSKLHDEKFHNLYFLPNNIIMVIKIKENELGTICNV
jgi:hypothetical protein